MRRDVRSLPDTNVIIRYLVNDDPALFKKAVVFFNAVKNGSEKAVILESVIAECVYVLTKIYKVPRDRTADSLIDILHYKGIVNDDRDKLIKSLSVFADSSMDIVDCILCTKSLSDDCRLFSFDDEMNRYVEKGFSG